MSEDYSGYRPYQLTPTPPEKEPGVLEDILPGHYGVLPAPAVTEEGDLTGLGDHLVLGDLIGKPPEGVGPYSPVHFEPATTPSGNLAGYAVEITDAMGGRSVVGRTGPNYLLVKNQEFYDMAMEITRETPFDWEVQRTFFDGSRYALEIDILDENRRVATQVGDTMRAGVIFRNSYDGSSAADFMFYVKQLICVNGCVSTKMFERYRFRHTNSHEGWADELRKAAAVLQNAPENLSNFVEVCNVMSRVQLTDSLLRDLISGPLSYLGASHLGRIMQRYYNHETERNLYGLLSAGTNVYWHDERQTASSYRNNDHWTSKLVEYAQKNLN